MRARSRAQWWGRGARCWACGRRHREGESGDGKTVVGISGVEVVVRGYRRDVVCGSEDHAGTVFGSLMTSYSA